MATTTPNYGLTTGVVTDDFVEASHHNRVADTLDHVLGEVLKRLFTCGAHEGWELTPDKAVTAGSGLIAACWCHTSTAQNIAGLTNGAVNWVYAVADAGSAPAGSVQFIAQVAPPGPAWSALLGTIELDGEGGVVEINNEAAGVQRQCHAVAFGELRGRGVVEALGGGESALLVVDHATEGTFRVPGDLRVETAQPEVEVEVVAHHRGDQFKVRLTNTSEDTVDAEYSWSRAGVLAQSG